MAGELQDRQCQHMGMSAHFSTVQYPCSRTLPVNGKSNCVLSELGIVNASKRTIM
jgi:hypothetical protein